VSGTTNMFREEDVARSDVDKWMMVSPENFPAS